MNWQVIGHDKNKKFFSTIIKSGQISHAYLFYGQDMIGKKTFALDLYKIINNRSEILATDADVKILSPKKDDGGAEIYIEEIRNVKKFLSLKSNLGPYKYVIIDDADTLTIEASNALLKILEEPQKKTILILISSKPKQILPTIISRCSAIKFNSVADNLIADYLAENKIKKEDKDFISKIANGRLGWIIRVIMADELNDIKKSIEELNKICKQGIAEKIIFAKKMFEDGDYIQKIENWMNYLQADILNDGNPQILKGLNKLYPILIEPSFNHRLALENFFINIDSTKDI
jgi:DNA polymerase-3 subunit delta'